MNRLTRKERDVLLAVIGLLLLGIAARAWRESRPPQLPEARSSAVANLPIG